MPPIPLSFVSGRTSVTAGPAASAVFSPTTYTGNSLGSTSQTIINDVNISANGGMVWIKGRFITDHNLFDTVQGANTFTISNATTRAQTYTNGGVTVFNTNGFTMGPDSNTGNNSGQNYISWTFREAARFFDVVTYTGNGAVRNITHNLNSIPGCILIKRTDAAASWQVYHRGLQPSNYLVLNSTAASATDTAVWNATEPTSTVFTLGSAAAVNANTATYVAYLFAHQAGGFGTTGRDSVITCGSYTGTGTTLNIDCGFPSAARFVMIKCADSTGEWYIWDSARGIGVGNDPFLRANSSATENTTTDYINTFGTGFQITSAAPTDINGLNATFIYVAID